jgi:syntaxin 16
MAIRNRTLIFIQYRNEKKSFKKTNLIKKNVDASKIKLLGMNPETDVDLEEGKTNKLTLPPSWLSIIDDINYDISRIKSKMKELNEYHKNHLLPTIDDKIEDEQTIEILTEHITKLFQQAQTKILRIGAEGVNKQEESIKKKCSVHIS